MKGKLNKNVLSHGITVLAFMMFNLLGLGSASTQPSVQNGQSASGQQSIQQAGQREQSASSQPNRREQISFERIIDAPGVSKETIFNRAYMWFEDFVWTSGAGTEILFLEKESGLISGSHVVDNITPMDAALGVVLGYQRVYHIVTSTINLEINDEICILTFSDTTWRNSDSRPNVSYPLTRRGPENRIADIVVREWEKAATNLTANINR